MNTDKRLMQQAIEVIKSLRDENHYLRTRISGFDDSLRLMKAGSQMSGSGLMAPGSPDVFYQMEKRIAEMDQEEKRQPQPELSEDRKSEISAAMERKLRP